ncbi:uncharacterized protein LOC136763569 [Amia ocellicauda]|uniref:uncharacterized protein LOC136763569 n=1 Tax=Amia ocellicauda TaxID=2972642 RepID=UPI003463C831
MSPQSVPKSLTLCRSSALPASALVSAAACVLLIALLLLCGRCRRRKSDPPSAEEQQDAGMELASVPPDATEDITLKEDTSVSASEPQQEATQESEKGVERQQSEAKAKRRLPDLPMSMSVKKPLRRHSSYTTSSVYDVVSEVKSDSGRESWLAKRQSPDCSHLYDNVRVSALKAREAEDIGAVYAKVNKSTTLALSSSQGEVDTMDNNVDYALYSNVFKIRGRAVQSTFIQ